MSYSTILYEIEDNILTITLNRPEALNAFNTPMLEELLDACDRADADDNVKAIIVTGAGRAFCAGADLSSGGKTFNSHARADRNSGINPDGGGRLTLRLYELNKPIIAAINGPAVGVGVTMTLAMDLRLVPVELTSPTDDGAVRLHEARHPILALRELAGELKVVPNEIELAGRGQVLVVSGPNTGGKTVTLKTFGMFALLSRAGLPLPVEADSKFPLFERVLSSSDPTTVTSPT